MKKLAYKKDGSFILSTKDEIYHGVPFDSAVSIHGEENAIGTMIPEEGKRAEFSTVLIIGSPKETIMPCGRCRVAIKRYGSSNVTILCSTKFLTKIEKYTISELYPFLAMRSGFLNNQTSHLLKISVGWIEFYLLLPFFPSLYNTLSHT